MVRGVIVPLLGVVALHFQAQPPAIAGDNPYFTVPLHAKASTFETCDGYLPVDCLNVPPTVDVPANTWLAIFVFIAKHDNAAVLQTGFRWPADWTWSFALWDCQPGFAKIFRLDPTHAGGAYPFICLHGPAMAVLGRVFIKSGAAGCFQAWEPPYPLGIHLVDCTGDVDRIRAVDSRRLGRVCVEAGGNGACETMTSVEGSTWGAIKSTYQ